MADEPGLVRAAYLCAPALISNHTVAVRHQWFDARLPGSSMDLVRGLGHDRTFAPGTFAPPLKSPFEHLPLVRIRA